MNSEDQRGNDLPVELSQPARRVLVDAGYSRLEQFSELRVADIKKLHGVGPKAINQLRHALETRGLSFADEKA